ncbi:hypothetical protein BD410DRAFT_396303 [Rickenella mellea]|uniref:Uncharacterized protein n=1 Tax=Rickenella mellea TaxID=50990 RepID=A0A4Y7PWI8_9AGAM|nr:hypothetical protein BD410DRAFT_396303 [Rickenella mellea]
MVFAILHAHQMLQIFTHSGNVFRNITGEFRTHIERALTTNLSMYNALSNHDSSSSDFEEILHLFAQYLTDTLPSRPSRGLNSRIAQVGMIGCFMGSSSIRWLSNVDTPNWTIHYEGVWPSPDGAYCIPLQGGGCQACSEFSDQSVFGQPMFVKSTMPRVEAYDYLIKFGPALAKNLGVNLEDIFIVEEHAEYFSSYFVADTYDVPHHYTPESDVWPELFFHVLPLPADHSRFPEPWGYYSFDPRPTPPGSQLPLRLCRVDNTEIWYESTFPIRAFTKQVCLVNYVSLAPGEVQILQWIYDNISKELNESATLGEAKFAEAPEIDCYSSYSHLVGDEDGDCLVYGHGMTLCTGCSGSVNFTPRGLRF